MITIFDLKTSSGPFTVHHFAKEGSMIVFVPGLMEPKGGLFYIWSDIARDFYKKGYSSLLFDLAGQGDSLLDFSLDLWCEQINSIIERFGKENIHFICRGISSFLLPKFGEHIAVNPALFHRLAKKLINIKWMRSPINLNLITPKHPESISDIERECFHQLGAEAECIGGLEVNQSFTLDLLSKLPKTLGRNVHAYFPNLDHPLFDKQSEREELIAFIKSKLKIR